jgi:hypothetical protein
MEIANLNYGNIIELGSVNYTSALTLIGQSVNNVLKFQDRFQLSNSPVNPASITVTVDSVSTTGFVYFSSPNQVEIDNPGTTNSVIDIHYCKTHSD